MIISHSHTNSADGILSFRRGFSTVIFIYVQRGMNLSILRSVNSIIPRYSGIQAYSQIFTVLKYFSWRSSLLISLKLLTFIHHWQENWRYQVGDFQSRSLLHESNPKLHFILRQSTCALLVSVSRREQVS
jgi:hypothetical protein